MRRIIYLKLCCMALLFLPYILVGQEYVPLTVSSGFNADVIAEASPAGTTTTNAVDGESSPGVGGYAFMTVSYPGSALGIPDNGIINSVTTPDLILEMAPY